MGVLCVGLVKGLLNMYDEPQDDLGTLQAIAHWPFTPALLLGATHLIIALYGQKQFHNFENKERPPLPILFPFIIGKGFMMMRLVMAYSSQRMSYTLDFFVRQEFLLVLVHVACSGLILPFVPQRSNRLRDMVMVFRFILLMDAGKTVANYLLWSHWTKGVIADTIDRLPDQPSQICASLLIHAVLDMLQSASTVFTMFLSRWMIHMIDPEAARKARQAQSVVCNSERKPDTPSSKKKCLCLSIPDSDEGDVNDLDLQRLNQDYYHSFHCKCEVDMVIFSIVNTDGFWVRHLFKKGDSSLVEQKKILGLSEAAANEISFTHKAYKDIPQHWIEWFRWVTCAKKGLSGHEG